MNNVIAHLDMDCFYAQVEGKRLGLSPEVPLGVVQWDSLIAVNYSARPFGVKRGDKMAVAKDKCPDLVLAHVETIGGDKGTSSGPESSNHDRSKEKVSLERYRAASMSIMSVIERFCPALEKASIDEVYLDLRPYLPNRGRSDDVEEGGEAWSEEELVGMGGHRLDPDNVGDLALLEGARLVRRIRESIREETGYTVSAGIAHCKMMAKVASARNKPNKQTVVPHSATGALLQVLPLREVRGLGGKLGEQVETVIGSGKMAADLQRFTEAELIQHFGKQGPWLYRICRAQDDEPVVANLKPKSMLAFKSFSALQHLHDVRRWLEILATELVERMETDRERNHRRARTVVLHHRGEIKSNDPKARYNDLQGMRSRSMAMPQHPTVPSLVQCGLTLFNRLNSTSDHPPFPCTRLALGALDFIDVPPSNGKGSIKSFLRTPPPPPPLPPPLDKAEGEEEDVDKQGPGEEGCVVENGDGVAVEEGASLPPPPLLPEEDGKSMDGGHESITTTSTSTSSSSMKRCERCGCQYRMIDEAEHLDYHFAMDLQASLGQQEQELPPPPRHTSGGKKGSGGGSGKRKREAAQGTSSIHNFFKRAA